MPVPSNFVSQYSLSQGRQVSVRFTYANATDRANDVRADGPSSMAAEELTDNDLGSISHQLDDDTFYFLAAVSPSLVWIELDTGEGSVVDIEVRKDSAGTINAFEVVYFSSWDAGLDIPLVERARADSASTMPSFGMALASFTNTTTGVIRAIGIVDGIDTDTPGWTLNDTLYVSSTVAGELVNTRPTGETTLVQQFGIVGQISTTDGNVGVSGAKRANSLPNLGQDKIWVGDANAHPQQVDKTTVGVTAHSALTGLGAPADDHTQYSLVSGTRAFTGTVGGITPVDGADLSTKDYVDSVVQGVEWQDSVFDRNLATPPVSPTVGDRYIVASSGTGAWAGRDDDIAEWDGSAWIFTVPTLGMTVAVDDENRNLRWNGSAWVFFGTTVAHGNLSGLNDDHHVQYQLRSEQDSPNGYAGLDGSTKLDGAQQVYGSAANTAVQGNDTRVPTQDENDALQGTNGTPSNTNRYVTNTDPRLSAATSLDVRMKAGAAPTWTSVTTVTLSIGNARSDDDAFDIDLLSAQAVAITTSGLNGLDTGVELASSWYAIWLIGDSSLVNPAGGLLSLSFTTPTLPGTHDKKRLVGAVRNNASSDFLKYRLDGDRYDLTYWYDEDRNATPQRVLSGGGAASFTTVDCSGILPPLDVEPIILCQQTSTSVTARVRPNGEADASGSTIVRPSNTMQIRMLVTDQNIQYQAIGGGGSLNLDVVGFRMSV